MGYKGVNAVCRRHLKDDRSILLHKPIVQVFFFVVLDAKPLPPTLSRVYSTGGRQRALVAIEQRHPLAPGNPGENRHVLAAAEAEPSTRVDTKGAVGIDGTDG